jgi:hypothetical protein
VALLAAWLVFALWYPSPLATLTGGASLFLLLVSVDLILGPVLTAIVASPKKGRTELRRDIAVIVALQLAALAYGLHTVAAARPVALVFEFDLFRLVNANDIEPAELQSAPPELRQLPWSGPRTLSSIKPPTEREQYDTIQLGLAGVQFAALPHYWRDYASEQASAWQKASPLTAEHLANSSLQREIKLAAEASGVPATALRTLPLLARHGEGTVVLAPPNARIVGILPAPLSP